jgi:hypothetical protein
VKKAGSGKIAYADSWHESACTLLNDWFDSLRTQAAVQQFGEQLQLSRQLRDIAAKRVKAGEAAKLDLQLAETEVRTGSAVTNCGNAACASA